MLEDTSFYVVSPVCIRFYHCYLEIELEWLNGEQAILLKVHMLFCLVYMPCLAWLLCLDGLVS